MSLPYSSIYKKCCGWKCLEQDPRTFSRANDVMYMPLQPCKLRSFLAVVQGERNCCTCVIIVYELWRYTVPFFSTVSDSFDEELGWKCLEQDLRTYMSEQMSLMSTCIAVPVPPAWIKSMMYAKVCGMWSLVLELSFPWPGIHFFVPPWSKYILHHIFSSHLYEWANDVMDKVDDVCKGMWNVISASPVSLFRYLLRG